MGLPPLRVSILGAGRLATAIVAGLRSDESVRVVSCWARRADAARALAGRSASLEEVVEADLCLIVVSDAAIAFLAARLAALDLRRVAVVAHCSGALDLSCLEALRGRGPALGRLHPLASVPHAEDAAGLLRTAPCVVTGEDGARDVLLQLARALSLHPTWVPSLDSSLYHAGAALASNGVTALLAAAAAVLGEATQGALGLDAARHLAATALRGLEGRSAEAALTGPIRRGDDAVVQRHLAALAQTSFVELYVAVMKEALAVARRAGVDEADARRIEAALARADGGRP